MSTQALNHRYPHLSLPPEKELIHVSAADVVADIRTGLRVVVPVIHMHEPRSVTVWESDTTAEEIRTIAGDALARSKAGAIFPETSGEKVVLVEIDGKLVWVNKDIAGGEEEKREHIIQRGALSMYLYYDEASKARLRTNTARPAVRDVLKMNFHNL